MSRSWNGEDFVEELSQQLGDISDSFKTRVLGWTNDVIFDICSRHDWGHKLVKGKKYLTSEDEIQSLEVAAPSAPDVELLADGELTAGTSVSVVVTYVQDNGVESKAGTESEALAITETDKTIKLTNIPTSNESLVTKRRIYLAIDGEYPVFHSEISDNITTTLEISTLPDSEIGPPDYDSIRKIDGSPYFEDSPSNRLKFKPMDQLRTLAQGKWSVGSPQYFCNVADNSIALYPAPSNETEVCFNYYRNPFALYATKDSQPDIPVNLKPVLKAGVVALGYEYRDRDGQEGKRGNYEALLVDAINRLGASANVEYSVRDVYGNSDGFEVG